MNQPTETKADLSLRAVTGGFVTGRTVSWQRRWLGSPAYWTCQLIGWGGGLLLNNVLLTLANGNQVSLYWLIVWSVYALAGLVVTHLLRVVILSLWGKVGGWWFATLIVLCTVAAAAAMLGPKTYFLTWLTRPGKPLLKLDAYVVFLGNALTFLSGWLGGYFTISLYRSNRENQAERLKLEAAVKDAELRVLKAQINPHFLFNCLNSTWAMIPRELVQPRESLTLLADLLRAALTLGEKKTVSLRQEWETVQTYLALERIRFEQRLRVQQEIKPEAFEWPVPPFLLQTLVENAVKFGVKPHDEGGEITIQAFVHEATLHIRVTNHGQIANHTTSTGVGLKNSRARLQHLFGANAALTLTQEGRETVVAEITIREPINSPNTNHTHESSSGR